MHNRASRTGSGYTGYEDRYRLDKVFRTNCMNAGMTFLSYRDAAKMVPGPDRDPDWQRGWGSSAAPYGNAPPEAQAAYKVYQTQRRADKFAADEASRRGW